MSTVENGRRMRFETSLNHIRKEFQKMRESNDKLIALAIQLKETGHPAMATILEESTTTVRVALGHLRDVFREV